ncbi:bifunctional folylpolyglutamate synthase/dihydrofolate synthase [Teredinibacter waterburyi]|uniref:bifunctional folylpolyglutamate synthase/dihydrofolate synthase n=1 Tax=Teredinibacter waterburyi TaxID=1500538 RepID=UPI001FE424C1|nr:folylpolyglutamate synthase/dihydrofolate synthase family protein [Teredinibacter waterburyi]
MIPKPRFADLPGWLAWLEQLHPSEIDLGLERIAKVAKRLGFRPLMVARPVHLESSQDLPTLVTIAGTNGKGTCVAMLEQLLLAQDVTVGSFTSPHLLDYNERIKIDGIAVSDESLCDAFQAIDIARADVSLTYFEFGALAAFYIFQQRKVDYWLLEVGLGGRLDAVNCLWPDVAVITSIALDHQAWLGDTREKIGAEKAGIIRPSTPVICADYDPPNSLLDIVDANNATLFRIGEEFNGSEELDILTLSYSDMTWCDQSLGEIEIGELRTFSILRTQYAIPSIAAACQVARLLGFTRVCDTAAKSISKLAFMGRFQRVPSSLGNRVVVDVAHNPAATAHLATKLRLMGGSDQKLEVFAVCAMMADKDRSAALAELVPYVAHWYPASLAGNSRAATASALACGLEALGVAAGQISECDSVENAITQADERIGSALKNQADNTIILVFGSFFTASAALSLLNR